ncbi:MAG: DMT family transporter [Bacteroides sp.]|nr:DMT family transporter [Bacteroides sp.]MCM1389099.1 DMT family transporter [Bacteroides sp.]
MNGRMRSRESNMIWYHLGAILTMIAWGVSFVSTKVLLDSGLQPTEVYVYRTLLAYIIILIINHSRLLSNSLRDELLFMVCGLCAGSLYYIAENTALEYTLVSNVSLIVTLAPLLTTLLVGAIYKNERPGRNVLIGSFIAFVGVGFVIFNSSFELNVKPLGDLLALGAALSWAVYSLVLRKLSALYGVMFISRKTFFYGMLTAIPFLLGQPSHTPLSVFLQTDVILNLVFLGVFCSMLAFVIWAWVNKGLGAIKASNYLYFQPIVTLIASAILLGEVVSIVGYTGCALILAGVWFSDRYGKKYR